MTDAVPRRPLLTRRPVSWHHLGFRQLVRAWFFTNIADSALFLMLAVWVKELSGSDGAAAMVFVVIGLPALLAPFLGHLADRVSRKKLLVVANFLMVPILLVLLVVDSPSQLWLIYVVVFFYGTISFVSPAAGSGLLRDLLADDELASGNGVLATLDQGLRLVSPLIGTALYVAFGPYALVVLTAICFATTAGLLTRLQVTETPPATRGDGVNYWQDVTAGFTHLFRTPLLGTLTVVLAIAFGVVGMLNAAVFPIMEQGLQVDPAMIGVFVSVQGFGALAGGITSATVIRTFHEKGAIAAGVALVAVGQIPFLGTSVVLAFTGMLALGLGLPWIIVAYSTMRQRLTPSNLQGRTSAASNVALSLPQTLSTMAAATVIDVIDYRAMIGASVIVTSLCAMAMIRTRAPAASPGGTPVQPQ